MPGADRIELNVPSHSSDGGGSEAGRADHVDRLETIRHLLNRITFGPGPADLERVTRIGVDNYIDEQLNPRSIPLADNLISYTREPALTDSPARLFLTYGKDAFDQMERAARNKGAGDVAGAAARKEIQQLVRDNYQEIYTQVTDARLMRALYSPRQLEEVMVDFWFNHFNVSIDKGLDHLWVGSYEESAIRPHALGKFRELLGATAHHAAMLFYLDNWQNTSPHKYNLELSRAGKKFSGLNENYARELMELHTLGVDGGYTQKDVVELARVLTGHGIINRRSVQRDPRGLESKFGYYFDPDRHDFSDKILLGHVISGSGAEELEEALDLLCNHPATANYVSYKLAQYFTLDEPPATLVKKMADTFRSTGGDIKEVMRTLLKSEEFWSPSIYGKKFKSPYRFLLSGLRSSQSTINNTKPLLGFLRLQGMPLYQCQTPDGYKNTEKAWLHSNAILQRINFATALGAGRLPALSAPRASAEEIMLVTGVEPSSTTGQVVSSSPRALRVSLLLGSPEFMRY